MEYREVFTTKTGKEGVLVAQDFRSPFTLNSEYDVSHFGLVEGKVVTGRSMMEHFKPSQVIRTTIELKKLIGTN